MAIHMPDYAGDARKGSPASPPCRKCASADTEPVITMQRHTVDAEPWYRCEECGHVFPAPRDN